MKLGLEIRVLSIEPFDKSMTLSYEGHKREAVSHTVSEKLLVEEA